MSAFSNPLPGFKTLHTAAIDASSIIYMQKAGFLDLAAKAVKLHAPEAVIAETGYRLPRIEEHRFPADEPMPADEQVLDLARSLKIPVVSEDRKVLLGAKKIGLVYYNALMVLCFLLYKKRMGRETFDGHKRKLLAIARYSAEVIAFGEKIAEQVVAVEGLEH